MVNALDFLGGTRLATGKWSFDIPVELHGAFGGAFGGVVAACCVAAARDQSSARVPVALDCRFLRGLPAGRASVLPTLLYEGRSLACVSVDVLDERSRLCARSTVSLITPDALMAVDRDGSAGSRGEWPSYEQGTPWRDPPRRPIPIITTFAPRVVSRDERGVATAIRIPWDDYRDRGAESVCLAADICTGPPVAAALAGERVQHPNPDLSLRFTGAVVGPELIGVGRVERIEAGVASVAVEVRSGGEQVSVGISCSLVLRA